jgi:hypothetical protein
MNENIARKPEFVSWAALVEMTAAQEYVADGVLAILDRWRRQIDGGEIKHLHDDLWVGNRSERVSVRFGEPAEPDQLAFMLQRSSSRSRWVVGAGRLAA